MWEESYRNLHGRSLNFCIFWKSKWLLVQNLVSRGDVFNLNTIGGDTQEVGISETQMDNSDVPDDSGEGTSMNKSQVTMCYTSSIFSLSVKFERALLKEEEGKFARRSGKEDVPPRRTEARSVKEGRGRKVRRFPLPQSLPPLFKELPPLKKLSVRNQMIQVLIDSKNSSQ